MKLHYYTLPLLPALIAGQSAPQFEVVVQNNLPVTYTNSSTQVTPPGVLIPRNDTLVAPTVYVPESANADANYIVFMIDQDVPRNGTTFTLLHWFQPSLHRTDNDSALMVTMIDNNMTTNQGAPYIPPSPPGGSGPHRYNFILYTEPANFTIPEAYASISPPADTSARIGFDLTAFAAAAGLGEPIAANYLRVLNGTEAETSSAATMTGTSGVAPTEQPTMVASTTGSAAGTTASTTTTAGNNSPSDATTGGEASATQSGATPAASANDASPLVATPGNMRNSMLALALAAVGAAMLMA